MGNSLAHPEDAGKRSGGSSVPFGDLVGRHGAAATPADPFRRFWNKGFRGLLPVVPPTAGIRDAGKRPGVRGASGWSGRSAASFEATPELIAEWANMGAGVGLRCHDGIIGVDFDTTSPRWSAWVHETALRILGPAKCRIGRAPKGLLPYRTTEPLSYRQCRFDDDMDPKKPGLVELLAGETKWFVVDGIHPATGAPYRWPEGTPSADDLTIVTPAQIDSFFAALEAELPRWRSASSSSIDRASVDQTGLAGDPDRVRRAMEALPNTPELFGYHEWLRVAVALRAALPQDEALGLELFEDWTEKAEIGEPSENAARVFWSIDPPFGFGAAYLEDLAVQHSRGVFSNADRYFEPPSNVVSLFPETPEPEAPARFAFESFDDLASVAFTQPSRPLIKGLLDQGAMSVLYGESNSGKTFVALDIAFHVAAGLAWNDARVTQAPVVYVAAEGGLGFAKRITALRQRYGSPPAGHFQALRSPVNLLRADADLAPLIASLRALEPRPGFVLLDTLSRVMAGGDENASTDMGALVRNLDAIRAATGAHLMVVHHTGKNLSKGARGHSLLRAATDTEIEIANGMLRATKQRDIEKNLAVSFALQSVVLGVDDEGDTITSATVRILPTVVVEPAEIEESAAEIEQRERVALAVYRALDGETTANIGTSRKRLNEEFAAAGLKVGASLPMVRDKVSSALASPVTIEVDGQIVRIEARKIGAGGKAPWSISALRVPGEAHSGSSEAGNEPIDEGAETLESERKSTVFD